MDQRLSLVTLGVDDLPRARAFYEALGWEVTDDPEEILFFQMGGMVLALWSHDSLAADTRVDDRSGWGGIVLAQNVRSAAEVDAVLEEARVAGGTIARMGEETPWGGYSGVFFDPDSHAWEIAYNPAWTMADDGAVTI